MTASHGVGLVRISREKRKTNKVTATKTDVII